jgi:sugar phosphate permease
MIAGNIYYTQVSAHGSFVSELLPGYLLIGIALPFTFIPISIAALAGVSHDEAGLASGLINTAQQIGGAVGVAVCSSVLFSASAFVSVSGTSNAFWVLVGISVAALVTSVVLIRNEQLAPEVETQSSPGLA